MKQRGTQKGVALIVTLILLSVITIVVVAFLAVSQRNRKLVATSAQLVNAQLMSDAALNRAQSEIAARMLSRNNVNAYEMLVSTNFYRTVGFVSGVSNRFNVSYSYDNVYDPAFGTSLSYQDLMLNLVNLDYDPRPPVFIPNDPANPFSRDFRFYLDLNRNGRFDATGLQTIIDTNGVRDTPDRHGAISNYFVGDPQWIGVLDKPDQKHSSSNRFIGRYAYVVVPDGLTLDLNGMHNYARPARPAGDGFMRNMGVGTWEINMAGFLVGLNTNYWPAPGQFGNVGVDYTYNVNNLANPNTGFAFDDALNLLFYRYRSNPSVPSPTDFNNLSSYGDLYGGAASDRFRTDLADGYSDGPLLVGEVLPRIEIPQDPAVAQPWSGSPTPQEYFSQDDLFNPRKVGVGFLLRLDTATRAVGSYNSGTYYRLLSELGTRSGTEPASFVPGVGTDAHPDPRVYLPTEKMNLNFDNRDLRTLGGRNLAATTVVPWEPLAFFTNAADRLLRSQAFVGSDGRIISLTNIMIWPTNNYDSAVHRCLQVAANLFDATTNYWTKAQTVGPEYPSVFRPMLRRVVTNGISYVYISGYELQSGINTANLGAFIARNNYIDLKLPGAPDLIPLVPTTNQRMPLGVSLVVGVKKGYPNFNELAIQTVINAQRNLILQKAGQIFTNQMYILSVSNVFGLEAWNSYGTAFPRDLQLAVEVDFSSTIQNRSNRIVWPRDLTGLPVNSEQTYATNFNIAASSWGAGAFQIPIFTNNLVLTNSIWQSTTFPFFRPATRIPTTGGSSTSPLLESGFPIPDWQLYTTNRIRYVLTDNGRIVDFVNIDGMVKHVDVSTALANQNDTTGEASIAGRMWLMDRIGGSTDVNVATSGIELQMLVASGFIQVPRSLWNDYSPTLGDKDKAINGFRAYLGFPPTGPGIPARVQGRFVQAPFSAARKLYIDRRYQVNDPLVHYKYQDIYDQKFDADQGRPNVLPPKSVIPTLTVQAIGKTNQLYSPWEGNKMKDGPGNLTTYNPVYTDPLINRSDDWNFPTNKFPSLGWMGRVHRGTPWQTIYLKAMDMPPPVGSGNTNNIVTVNRRVWALERGNALTIPSSDWRFLDVFTTAPTPSATRGQLSVNQTGEAAWAAVLAGVITLTNDTGANPLNPRAPSVSASEPIVIQPGSEQFYRIVDGINRTRSSMSAGFFTNKGGILSVPELSLASPYLNRAGRPEIQGISDVAMERIPQQILSLLQLGEPRVVIYAYGQSLAPAKNSLNLDPDFYQVVTNYQVTGEFVTRSVVRFEGSVTNLSAVVVDSKVLPPQ